MAADRQQGAVERRLGLGDRAVSLVGPPERIADLARATTLIAIASRK